MEIKTTYNVVLQLTPLLQSLENNTKIKFSKRVKVMDISEEFSKQNGRFTKEIQSFIDRYADRGEDGNPIMVEGGGVKIKEEFIDVCNKEVQELYATEVTFNFEPLQLPEDCFETFQGDREAMRFIQKYFLEA